MGQQFIHKSHHRFSASSGSPKSLKILNRFFYLSPRTKFFGNIFRKVHGLGYFRARLLTSGFGVTAFSALCRLKSPLRLLQHAQWLGSFTAEFFFFGHLRKRFCLDSIKRKACPGSFYNLRVLRGLPVRGQRTKTNSRTVRTYFKNLGVFRGI